MAPLAVKILVLISSFLQMSTATDTITQGQRMDSTETIVSANGIFVLGFFVPGNSKNVYLGIWYKNISIENRTVVWVANRQRPISSRHSSSCFLTINKDGDLAISDGGGISLPFTLVSTSSSSTNTSAILLDSGNLVLKDNNSNSSDHVFLWQSFDHPSDTLLPGMKLGFNKHTGRTWSLSSWTTLEDPAIGSCSMFLNSSSGQDFIITNGSQKYWNGLNLTLAPDIRHFYNFSYTSDENGHYFTFLLNEKDVFSRLVMDLSGKAKLFFRSNDVKEWSLFWEQPKPSCQVHSLCGAFSTCDENMIPNCRCLAGYKPYSPMDWMQQHFSSGCVRRCRESGFLVMEVIKFPVNSVQLAVGNAEDCIRACSNDCSCSACGYSNSSGCSIWKGDLLGIEQSRKGGDNLYLRLDSSDISINYGDSNTRKKKKLLLIVAPKILMPLSVIMLILGLLGCCVWRRKMKQRGKKEISQDLMSFDFSTKTKAVNSQLSDVNKNESGERWDAELPLFSLRSISTSTDNFKEENKLGQGGFGPVYKGKLLNGREVAIKRLSKGSGQGLEELKNEARLIAKLQHRNLVRLLGCCIEGEEKILIYEYMPNKSLDFFLFDSKNRSLLDWEKHVHIIEGISQGLLYLHEHSRLRIIHRDLKASNILLDSEMNAKISDFGMARMFGGNELQANTNRVVGTYGYMSPEYAIEGLFSIKSDVFSFGVLLLEILSGKKNTSFYLSDSLTLLGHAWNLWRSERGLELIDLVLGDSASTSKALRYINVALLCVQEQAIDRPTMSDVVGMLSSEVTSLPSPKQPAFCTRSNVEKALSLIKQISSRNVVTITDMEGR